MESRKQKAGRRKSKEAISDKKEWGKKGEGGKRKGGRRKREEGRRKESRRPPISCSA